MAKSCVKPKSKYPKGKLKAKGKYPPDYKVYTKYKPKKKTK